MSYIVPGSHQMGFRTIRISDKNCINCMIGVMVYRPLGCYSSNFEATKSKYYNTFRVDDLIFGFGYWLIAVGVLTKHNSIAVVYISDINIYMYIS